MISYSVIDTGMAFEDKVVHGVFEEKTKQVIAVSVIKDTARAVVKGLVSRCAPTEFGFS
jgi:hypothetical protein